ncbi:MAG: protein NO VEIN domain-containing protein [Candidatus Cryptobacteroides sp.]
MFELDVNSFNPELQYRCDFIRGKSISRMEDYLSVYVTILNEICPIAEEQFANTFDRRFANIFHISLDNEASRKVVHNHRTENVTKILGLVYRFNGVVYLSKRTQKFLKDNDQPALFKSVFFQFQQPNGAQKFHTYMDKFENEISIRPFHYIVKLLKIASENDIRLTKDELYYYVLNCKQTLQGRVSPEVVFEKIKLERAEGIERKVRLERNYAWTFQHMREQLDYLELANLIRMDRYSVYLNTRESKTINAFIEELDRPLRFNPYYYNLEQPNIDKEIEFDWLYYMGLSKDIDLDIFDTTATSFDYNNDDSAQVSPDAVSTLELGDRGEAFIMRYEKEIVGAFNQRLVNKVNHFGRIHGLGYDITSIEANRTENRDDAEKIRYIEVKTTARVSPPNPDFQDSINLTRNEWVAAGQQREHFYIYRLYFTNSGVFLYIINNPYQKDHNGQIYVTPTSYRMEFVMRVADQIVTFEDDGQR